MSEILAVRGLCKRYPGFSLEDVGFSLEKGEIMGFIGRNGAGKTTTLKSLLDMVHPDAGDIRFFGLPLGGNETEIKQRLGFVSGGADYYMGKRLGTILDVTRRFYRDWDERACGLYMEKFALDRRKLTRELSAGMKVKFALVLALSHGAELLILDEPTSGLDPVSREDLLETFLDLADQGVSVIFSTHITSDLEKCAGRITYIQRGRIVESCATGDFVDAWRLAAVPDKGAAERWGEALVGLRRSKEGFTALVRPEAAARLGLSVTAATLEDVMVHLEKEGEAE